MIKRLLWWPLHWWWSRQRAVDMQFLWPACKQHAKDLDHAKAAFAAHAFQDPCWIRFYGHDQLCEIIDALE